MAKNNFVAGVTFNDVEKARGTCSKQEVKTC